MTDRMAMVQTRVPIDLARQADEDAAILGLGNRSAAVREGLRLLHRQARRVALVRDYDAFYGDALAPITEVTAAGEEVAADTITDRETTR